MSSPRFRFCALALTLLLLASAPLQSAAQPATGEEPAETPAESGRLQSTVVPAADESAAAPTPAAEQPASSFWQRVILTFSKTSQLPYVVHVKTAAMEVAREEIVRARGEIIGSDATAGSFHVLFDPKRIEELRNLESVAHVQPLMPEEKLSASLKSIQAGNMPVPAAERPGGEVQAEKLVDVNILLYPGHSPALVVQRFLGIQGVVPRSRVAVGSTWKIMASVPPSQLEKLTSLPEVWFVEEDVQAVPQNDHAGILIGVPEMGVRLTGEGQIIGHADTGLDVGLDGEPLHDDLEGKLAAVFAYGRPGDWSDPDGHGTHTAATLVGSGQASGTLYRGIAPGARLVHQALEDAQGKLQTNNLQLLLDDAYKAGARIHSNSWSLDILRKPEEGGAYRIDSIALDAWAWGDGKPRDMLVVCAAGNAGDRASTVGYPGTAKNCLTVGAIESDRAKSDPGVVAPFSSRGPVQGERIKPELVAPGTWIASARTQAARVAWSADLEAGPEEFQAWGFPEALVRANGEARSGSHSLRYQRPPGPRFREDLELPALDLPAGFPLHLQMSLKGHMPAGMRLQPLIQVEPWPWKPLEFVEGQTFSRWTTKSFALPPWALGGPVLIAIRFVTDQETSEAVDLRIDDLRLTTSNLGRLSELDLARPDDPVENLYALSSGTSMATPVVSGAAALVREFLVKNEGITPSAELIKAVLINGADRLGDGPWPNNDQGWGRINLRRSLPNGNRRLLHEQSLALREGETGSTTFEVTFPEELRITLAWCDPPGAKLVHNLDTVVFPPSGPAYYPLGASEGSPDIRNNVESLEIRNPVPGLWRVEVRAPTVPLGPQPYALVVSGAVRPASPSTAPAETSPPAQPNDERSQP